MSGVRLTDVVKSFDGLDVIHGVSLQIERGEFAVFVGPSGCGKSTLLRMIAGLEETSGGRIDIEDDEVTWEEPAKRGVAMVFQSYALYPHLSVYENMAFSLRLARERKADVERQVREAARILQLESHLEKKPRQLSGGQRQRVAIGRAIVRKPRVFLFDEPLSNLDAELRVQMRLELSRLHQQIGATMIYVTHDQVEAMTLADKIFVLQEGRVSQAGRPLELYDDPDNRFVAGFIGSPGMNMLAATVIGCRDGRVRVSVDGESDGELPARLRADAVEPGTPLTIGIRPEHARIVEGTGSAEAADAARGIPLEVEVVEELGDVSYLHARSGAGTNLVLERRGSRESWRGRSIRMDAAPEHVLLFDAAGERLR